MNTKKKILAATRELYNEKGISSVSVRDISKLLQISPGNFHYYYPNKSRLIVDLYQQMLVEFRAAMGSLSEQQPGVRIFLNVHRSLFQVQQKFRFIYLNLFDILHKYPEIKAMYLQARKEEQLAAQTLIQQYIQEGVIVPEITFQHIDRMVLTGQILNMAWVIDAEVHFQGQPKQQLMHYLRICCGQIAPYLTATALAEYEAYFEELAAEFIESDQQEAQ